MEDYLEVKLYNIEEDNWWCQKRRDIIYRFVKNVDRRSKILDVGCSGGLLVKLLMEAGFSNTFGIDVSERAMEFCNKHGVKNVCIMDCTKTTFNEEFDVIIASDILEHVEDDESTLKEWGRILKKGGRLIVLSPAFKFLWGAHDNMAHHYRRYSRRGVVSIIEKTGFKVERSSYWNFSLFIPKVLAIAHERMFIRENAGNDQVYRMNPIVNSILGGVVGLENRLLDAGVNLPFGVSVFVVATKE